MSSVLVVLVVLVVSALSDPAITGAVTVSGADGVSGDPVSPGDGCAAKKPNDRQGSEYPEASHRLAASARAPVIGLEPELADHRVGRGGVGQERQPEQLLRCA
jgi:hypothetical protein